MQSHRLVTLPQENVFLVAGAGVVGAGVPPNFAGVVPVVVAVMVADRRRLEAVVPGAGVVVVGTGVLVVGAAVEVMDGKAVDRAPKA